MRSLHLIAFAVAVTAAFSARGDSGAREAAGERALLVEVQEVIPDAVVDLRYATKENFLGRAVYPPNARCLLRREALEPLEKAADALRKQGYRLKLYDCYRPRSVQWEMWRILPRPGYVADPRKGSHHNRGVAVDLTLTDAHGVEVEMPTPYDTFTRAAHHGYAGASAAAKKHRELLREAMERAGFRKNRMEWWHYDLPRAGRFPVLDAPVADEPPCYPGPRLDELRARADRALKQEPDAALHDYAVILEHSAPSSEAHRHAQAQLNKLAPERLGSIVRRCADAP